ncbi:interleukin-5 receptor subunit alpha-like isoform X2 [Mustelus asterias]
MNPPTAIEIARGRLGEYIISWSGNYTCTGDIYYHFNYSYLDSADDGKLGENSRIIQTQKVKLDVELDRGIAVQIQLYRETKQELSNSWTKRTFQPSRDLFASVDNLTCIFYDNHSMNCTWNITENAPQDTEYLLSYRTENTDNVHSCTNNQQDEWRNTACRGLKYNRNLIPRVNICVSESSNKTKYPYCRNIVPAAYYKVDTPINVTVNKSTDEVNFELPKMHYQASCYVYQINITNWSDHVHKVINVNSTKYVISRDHKKRYSVQVRATTSSICYRSFLWSEWSKSFTFEPDAKDFALSTIIAALVVIFVVTVLMPIFICTRFQLWSKVCQPIPDPKEKFKGLFEDYDGDFQKWINKTPILITKTEECIPVTVKEL